MPEWQKYDLKKMPDKITPSMVQREYKRIIRTFGKPAPSPKVARLFIWAEKGDKITIKITLSHCEKNGK